jgi:hypothetical protein
MGRKLTIVFFSCMGAVICFLLASGPLYLFHFFIFFITIILSVLTFSTSLITSEVYNTILRATAQGTIRGISRLFIISMPLISFKLLEHGA